MWTKQWMNYKTVMCVVKPGPGLNLKKQQLVLYVKNVKRKGLISMVSLDIYLFVFAQKILNILVIPLKILATPFLILGALILFLSACVTGLVCDVQLEKALCGSGLWKDYR